MIYAPLNMALEPAVKQAPFCCPKIKHNERSATKYDGKI